MSNTNVEAFDLRFSDVIGFWESYVRKCWTDLKYEIRMIFGDGDFVTCHGVNAGTSLEYHQSAVWGEMDIFKVKDGKIVTAR